MVNVIKLSGKIINEDFYPLLSAIAQFDKSVVIVGGGDLARNYISILNKYTENQAFADLLGIQISRVNAQLLAYASYEIKKDVCMDVPTSLKEVKDKVHEYSLVFVGGFQPGQSTDTVAALVAEYLGEKYIVNASNIDGVYTNDPKKDKNARKLESISIKELIELLEKEGVSSAAGHYELIDIWALKIMQRSKISMRIVQANSDNIIKAIKNESVGTLIHP